MRETILRLVNANQGLKAVDLAMKVMGEINPVVFNFEEYWNALSSLVESNEIVEMEYILPQLHYRLKSLYFPKGTTIGIRNVKSKDRNIKRRDAEANRV